ncbi:MAG: aldehyde dehydrogenase [SAR324 cluster bacterium]|nr:aldehyde dehydrogenase [SAR324 cluster bacterium]
MPEQAALQATPQPVTEKTAIDAALRYLAVARERWGALSIPERVLLLRQCAERSMEVIEEWVRASCEAKGIPFDSPLAGEEWLAGPLCVLRYIRLLSNTLQDIQRHGAPRLPGRVRKAPDGRAVVPVFPASRLDALLYMGIKAEVWMQPSVTPERLRETMAPLYNNGAEKSPGISLVLGAGNVSSIPPTDVLSRLFCDGRVVLLKMHPVNAYLGPILERALAPLVDEGYLRIVYGGAAEGAYGITHPLVNDVHITGSIHTHDAIVWGATAEERQRRKSTNDPLLTKPITSELGNVSPVIVVPGKYTRRALRFQAENVVSMVTNNASFNCNAAKVLLTWEDWPQRPAFLQALRELLARVPLRKAYYPGAAKRHARFTEGGAGETFGEPLAGELPWTLIPGVPPQGETIYFREEAFCGVLVETALPATDAVGYLEAATEFANSQMWGTLNACLIVPPGFRGSRVGMMALNNAIAKLRYGTIGINVWPALGYALMSAPWGGWQGEGITLADVQSGKGWVHNSFLLEEAEKCVISGPLSAFPKPPWFATHKRAHKLGPKLVACEKSPSLFRLPGIVMQAIRG